MWARSVLVAPSLMAKPEIQSVLLCALAGIDFVQVQSVCLHYTCQLSCATQAR